MFARLFSLALLLCSLWSVQSLAASPFCEDALTSENRSLKTFRVSEVIPNVYRLEFDGHRDMVATFMRFQEHYESPEFRGKVFSRSQFKKWYRTTREGKFTYFSDWGGFNIPSFVLDAFYDKRFRYKTARENGLLDQFRDLYRSGKNFYVIGTPTGRVSTLKHEVAHGLYYTNSEYKKSVDAVLATVDLTPVHQWLVRIGYCKEVLNDEAHAYLATEDDAVALLTTLKANPADYEVAIQKLRSIFAIYTPGLRLE